MLPHTAWVRSAIAASLLLVPFAPAASAQAAALPPGCTGQATPGDDTITCTQNLTKGMVIDAGDGDDTIVVKADVRSGAVVSGGPGKDMITAYNVGGFRCPGDKFGAEGMAGGIVQGGPNDDRITIGGQARPAACAKAIPASIPAGNVGQGAIVRGGKGNDILSIGSLGYLYEEDREKPELTAVGYGGRLAGDLGDDTITAGYVTYGENPSGGDGVFGGPGHDKITLGTTAGIVDIMGDSDQTGPDTGNDTITVGTGMGGQVYGGPGDDTLNATGDLRMTTRLWGDAGNDTITAKDVYNVATLFGGDGEDILSASTLNKDGKIGAAILGGNGDDTITVSLLGDDWSEVRGDGLQGQTDPNVGSGRDTITVDTNKGAINGGNDDDTIKINLNQGKVDAGAGTDSCAITNDNGTAPTAGCENTKRPHR